MIVAIIPARGGSKRIKKKNIKLFLGKPIISYSIKAAIRSKIFDKIIVSTDSNQIMSISKKYGAEVLFKRPKNLSGDYVGTREVISHAAKWLKKNISKPKYICCLYPTAPLINGLDLKNSYKKIKLNKRGYVFSATKFSYPIQRAFYLTKFKKIKMFYSKNFNKRSQDLKSAYHDAGQFYWGSYETWQLNKPMFQKHSNIYLLPKYRVQDIDDIEDWKVAEKLFKIKK
tara:strand:- start:707 stop:1390 length:684 start_codon:yes stop_codon:yes gene_type:complete